MKFRPFQIVSIFSLVAAGILMYWLLGNSAEEYTNRKSLRPLLVSAPSRSVERQAFIEPDLPEEAGPVPLTDQGAELQNKVTDAVVTNLRFDNAPLFEVVEELKRQCEINFLMRADPNVRVSMNYGRSSLRDVLDSLAAAAGQQYDLQSHSVVFFAQRASPQMSTMTYRLPETGWAGVANSAGISSSQSAKAFLAHYGITMPEGASASYDAGSKRLIVRNTFDRLKQIRRLALIGPPDIPFVWQPVRFGERDFISDDQVSKFYGFRLIPSQDSISFRSDPQVQLEMQWQRDDRVIGIGGILYVLNLPVLESKGSIWISRADVAWTLEPVLRPRRAENTHPLTTVVIDIFPNGNSRLPADALDTQFRSSLKVAEFLKTKLESTGWTIVMTNADDANRSLSLRSARAAEHPDAVLFSIQMKSVVGAALETHLPLPAAAAVDPLRPQQIALASAVHASCIDQTKAPDGGIKSTGMDILEGLPIPGVILLIGNVADDPASNVGERGRFASAIADGLENYRRAVRRKPPALR